MNNQPPASRASRRRSTIADRMDLVEGLAESALLERLATKLQATRTVVVTAGGQVSDTFDVPDHTTQLRALDMAFELRGAYPAKHVAVTGTVHVEQLHQLAVEFAALPPERLRELAQSADPLALPPAIAADWEPAEVGSAQEAPDA